MNKPNDCYLNTLTATGGVTDFIDKKGSASYVFVQIKIPEKMLLL